MVCTQPYRRLATNACNASENMANNNNDFVGGNCLLLNSRAVIYAVLLLFVVTKRILWVSLCCWMAYIAAPSFRKLFEMLQLKFHTNFGLMQMQWGRAFKRGSTYFCKDIQLWPFRCAINCSFASTMVLIKRHKYFWELFLRTIENYNSFFIMDGHFFKQFNAKCVKSSIPVRRTHSMILCSKKMELENST